MNFYSNRLGFFSVVNSIKNNEMYDGYDDEKSAANCKWIEETCLKSCFGRGEALGCNMRYCH